VNEWSIGPDIADGMGRGFLVKAWNVKDIGFVLLLDTPGYRYKYAFVVIPYP